MKLADAHKTQRKSDQSNGLGGEPEQEFAPQVGQTVRVASERQIMSQLDDRGCTEGLPFMSEMLRYCGQEFPVQRWANSVCIFGDKIRFQKMENSVVLEMPRCCGNAHDGCQMACAFLWHTRWLKSHDNTIVEEDEGSPPASPPQLVQLLNNATRHDEGYQCQATQLGAISTQQDSVVQRLSDEYNLNRMGVRHFASDFCSTLLAKATRTQAGLFGPCLKRTPTENLNLHVGDFVKVKSKSAIRDTLNADGKNRGLWFDPAMLKYCGKTMQVTRRVEQFINESTGKMMRPSVPSIVLDEEHCSGRGRHYCSRLLHFFWREIWLEPQR